MRYVKDTTTFYTPMIVDTDLVLFAPVTEDILDFALDSLNKEEYQEAVRWVDLDKAKEFDEELEETYLDWVNNYLTIDRMASDYGIESEALEVIINSVRVKYEQRYGS